LAEFTGERVVPGQVNDDLWSEHLARYAFARLYAEGRNVLDAGCGTGECSSRLAELFPKATVLGVDIIDQHLDLARSRYANLAPRLAFEHQSIYELRAADRTFDLTVCRHVMHSIPYPDRVIAELARGHRRVFRSDDCERPRSPRIRSLDGSGGERAGGTRGRFLGVELFESHARFQQIARDAP